MDRSLASEETSQGKRLLLAAGTGGGLTLAWVALGLPGLSWLNEAGSPLSGTPALWLVWIFFVGLALMLGLAWWFGRRLDALSEACRQAQAHRAALQQLLPDWYWETDAEHRLTLLRPPPGAPARDWQFEARLGRPLWDDFGSEPGLWSAHRQMLEAREPFTGLPAHRREGNGHADLWLLRGVPRFDAQGRFAGYRGAARDVSARAELQFDRQIGLHLLDTVPDAVLLAEAVPGEAGQPDRYVIRHCNEPAARHIGEPVARLKGREVLAELRRAPGWPLAPVLARLGLPAEEAPARAAGAAWSAQVDRFAFEHGGTRRDALLLVFTPAAADNDEAAQQEREAVERELQSFSYTVSHDLRAPIRVVEGFTKILKEDYGRTLDRIGNDHLDRVLGAAARMNGMIDALLALSQLSAKPLQQQPVNLTQLATYIVDDLRRQSPERKVEVRIEPGMTAQGDPTLLRVALDNLLGNAWKYSGKRDQAVIEFDSVAEDGRTVYRVRDNGAGFDMRFADRLFGVFQRLHGASDFQGTGVGLATVQRIVRRHGGQIWAESEVGQGASFFFTLGEGRRPR
ncbi:ATP-binding protein [Aquabacterium sp. A7-Y]|uniref:sensor histidine kinase n=1 Tax=Aquabacterium sp. A7-Y TaxID=1349605 RepID=UPI00223DDFE6|nr:ATP-binding protein [Aquabacterium sp. A7-Y]MCW7540501.1 ATP-binding protein [Aquabacterium sp. A7-Y]